MDVARSECDEAISRARLHDEHRGLLRLTARNIHDCWNAIALTRRQGMKMGLEKLVGRMLVLGIGGTEVTDADPVVLMTALDRKASRKAQFIARHGAQAFIDLAESARRKGYRR